MSMVTLSSLGITNCYYIAANGSDSNDGASEAPGHPWLHAPQMANCAAVCKSTGVSAGVGLILRGGDTWHEGNSSAVPYTGGTWGFNNAPGPAGTSSHPIYVGVDPTWFSGSAWARPILTWDNPANASQTLSSCTYPSNDVIDVSGGAYYIFDNLEMTGACASASNPNVVYMNYGSMSGWVDFYNLYLHGWSHVGFPNPNNCTQNSTCMSAFRGSVNNYPPGDTFVYVVVDGSDSDPVPMEGCYCGAWRVAYSYFNNISQFITRTQNSFHDSAILNFVDNGHANVMESVGDVAGPSNVYATYNNVFGHLYVNSSVNSNVGFWPSRSVGTTLYWFNNVVYDAGPMEFFNIGLNGQDEGALDLFNNTFQLNHRTDGGVDNFSCSATANSAPYTNGNNNFITSDASTVAGMYAANCSGQGTDTGSMLMSTALAAADGYLASEAFVFSPISNLSPTVGAGANRTSTFCAALTSASAADPYLADAASSCRNDTRYACSYTISNHSLTCPARTAIARPATGAWDVGAFQYSSTTQGGSGVTPPPSVAVIVR